MSTLAKLLTSTSSEVGKLAQRSVSVIDSETREISACGTLHDDDYIPQPSFRDPRTHLHRNQ
jgi:hypothetical protein